MHPIRRAVVSLGINLQGAVDTLKDTPEVWVTDVSAVYETRPADSPEGAKNFLNAIVLFDTTLSVHTLLDRAQAIESAYGREREEPNAPRTLDVDLIVVGDRRAPGASPTSWRRPGARVSTAATTSSSTGSESRPVSMRH